MTTKTKTTRGAKRAVTKNSNGGNRADAECWALMSRSGGATAQEIAEATGWSGFIAAGPVRAAKAHGKKVKVTGRGAERRFTLA